MYGYSQIPGTKSKKDEKLRDKSVPYFQQESGPLSPGLENNHTLKCLSGIFSNDLDIFDYVGNLPEQHFSVWLFSNPGDRILFLLKFNEARITEWKVSKIFMKPELRLNLSPEHKNFPHSDLKWKPSPLYTKFYDLKPQLRCTL